MDKQILRVWHNVNGDNHFHNVGSVKQAQEVINKWIKNDLMFDDIIFNAFGLEILENGEWSEYYNDDGLDIMELIDNE